MFPPQAKNLNFIQAFDTYPSYLHTWIGKPNDMSYSIMSWTSSSEAENIPQNNVIPWALPPENSFLQTDYINTPMVQINSDNGETPANNNSCEKIDPNELSCSKSGLSLIKELEGCRLKAYQCSANTWTIGYGHTGNVSGNDIITQAEAEKYLKEDIKNCENYIKRKVTVPLTQNQFNALVSFVFNVGVGNFGKSTLLKKLNNSDYDGAAQEFLKWNKVKQNGKYVVSEGLNIRRQKEQEKFLS